jgi:hypothetical protein
MAAEPSQMKAHVRTYDGMIAMLKWGSVACAILVALVIWLIA